MPPQKPQPTPPVADKVAGPETDPGKLADAAKAALDAPPLGVQATTPEAARTEAAAPIDHEAAARSLVPHLIAPLRAELGPQIREMLRAELLPDLRDLVEHMKGDGGQGPRAPAEPEAPEEEVPKIQDSDIPILAAALTEPQFAQLVALRRQTGALAAWKARGILPGTHWVVQKGSHVNLRGGGRRRLVVGETIEDSLLTEEQRKDLLAKGVLAAPGSESLPLPPT